MTERMPTTFNRQSWGEGGRLEITNAIRHSMSVCRQEEPSRPQESTKVQGENGKPYTLVLNTSGTITTAHPEQTVKGQSQKERKSVVILPIIQYY